MPGFIKAPAKGFILGGSFFFGGGTRASIVVCNLALCLNFQFKKKAGNEERAPALLDRVGIDLELDWTLAMKAILEMNALADSVDAKFVVLDVGKKKRLEQFCEQRSLLYGRIRHADDEFENVRNSSAGPHANRKGHRLYADKIPEIIDRLKLLE